MTEYSVEIAQRPITSIAKLTREEQQRIRAAIDLLADEARPPRCVAMSGEESAYRVRVGDYRIVYEILDTRLVVRVVRVGHRRDVYQTQKSNS